MLFILQPVQNIPDCAPTVTKNTFIKLPTYQVQPPRLLLKDVIGLIGLIITVDAKCDASESSPASATSLTCSTFQMCCAEALRCGTQPFMISQNALILHISLVHDNTWCLSHFVVRD